MYGLSEDHWNYNPVATSRKTLQSGSYMHMGDVTPPRKFIWMLSFGRYTISDGRKKILED